MIHVTSDSFYQDDFLPAKYTCDGQGINPTIMIDGVPIKTKSLVLIVDDPDAPAGTFTHWLVWNIHSKTKIIKEGVIPQDAVQGTNSSGKTDYVPACPPSGIHHYYFRIFALDVMLNLRPDIRRQTLQDSMQGHILDKGSLMAKYSKRNA